MEPYIQSLIDIIKIESICDRSGNDPEAPYGEGVRKALDYALDLCSSLGFRTKNVDNMVGWAEIGSGDPLTGVLVHLDTVPIGDGWTAEQGEIRDGTLYGRGVSDDKGPAILSIYAMKELLDSGQPINGRIRIIFGQSEETGDWIDMKRYLETEEQPAQGFTPDADFPLIFAEKGLLQLEYSSPVPEGLKELKGGTATNVVPSACSAVIEKEDGSVEEFMTTGKAAHGSMPELGVNAISLMMAQLAEALDSPDDDILHFYRDCIGMEINGESMADGPEDEISGKLTLNVGKIFIEDDELHMMIDIRYPVTMEYDEIMAKLEHKVAPYSVSMRPVSHLSPILKDPSHPFVQVLLSAYRELTGDMSEPMVIGGGTYARSMDNIVAFGALLPGRPLTEHQPDERATLEDLELIKNIYYRTFQMITA